MCDSLAMIIIPRILKSNEFQFSNGLWINNITKHFAMLEIFRALFPHFAQKSPISDDFSVNNLKFFVD